jgi:uncharacterized glyoxalase superfamily protein PhnB
MKTPFGLRRVTPYLIVKDVMAVIEFAKAIVGAELDRGEPKVDENGRVVHAEITIGDSVVVLGEPTSDIADNVTSLYTYVEDCDQAYSTAIEMGFESVMEPAIFPHGDRYGGVKGPCGNTWWLVTHQGNSDNA